MRIQGFMVGLVALLLAGCVATGTTANSAPANKPTVVQPKWTPLTEGSTLAFDENYAHHPSEMKLSNNKLLRGQSWNDYLKAYVESFPVEKRGPILDGISRHVTDYDKVEGFIRFEPLRYISDAYSQKSYVAVVGILRPGKASAFLKLHYYGEDWLFAERVKVVTDGTPFQSPSLTFKRDHAGGKVWETVLLELSNPEVRALADRIVASKEAIIRFQGRQYYSDLTVSDRMREDIGAMLKALDAINGK